MWDADGDDAYLVDNSVGVDCASFAKALRVQSIDYEISFDREDLKQLYTGLYYKGLNDINITATITAFDSDLEMWAITTGNYDDWTDGNTNAMTLTEFQSMNNLSCRVDIFNTKEYADHKAAPWPDTLLKQIKFTGGKVTSVGDTRDVPGRGTQTLEITFTGVSYVGSGAQGR
jgi:hypothetical protein